jgi:xanthine/uracil permease
MHIKYGLDDKLEKHKMLIFGLQWLAVSIPFIIIFGKIVGILENGNYIPYIQKLFLLMGILIIIQILLGHKLPLVMGPAAVLLISILTSFDHGIGVINSSIIIGGLTLAILAASGLFRYVKKLFTSRVIIVILMLISFTLTPTIVNLISSGGQVPTNYNIVFSLGFISAIFIANAFLKGIWKSTLPLLALFTGSSVYYILFGTSNSFDLNLALLSVPNNFIGPLAVPDIGILIAFLISFLALAINDLSSIESVGTILSADKMEKRLSKGITITGIGNIFAGLFGVIGPVNYTISPGIIAATGVASRFTLIPAAIGLLILAISPLAINLISNIPSPVIGVILLYVLAAQIGAALLLTIESGALKSIDDGIILGLPVLLGTVIAFLPSAAAAQLPAIIRPIAANGFVIGALAVLILEHMLYPRTSVYSEN